MLTSTPDLSGSILFTSFIDSNGNSQREATEALFPTQVQLRNATGETFEGMPEADGLRFSGLAPGEYDIGFRDPYSFNALGLATVLPGETAVFDFAFAPPPTLSFSVPEDGFVRFAEVGGIFMDLEIGEPAHGLVLRGEIGRGGGPLYYVPDRDFTGEDSFLLNSFSVFELRPPPATVAITVVSLPELPGAPVATDDFGFQVELGQGLQISVAELLANDRGEGLYILGVAGTAPTASIEFYADAYVNVYASTDQAGPATFTYGVADAAGRTDLATFTIQVLNPALPGATEGDDSLTGTAGPDRLEGLGGNDLLQGGDGSDTILGGAGQDTLRGGRGEDTLTGGNGDDALDGGSGYDRLDGGPGADRLRGGASTDLFIMRRGEIADPLLNGGRYDHIVDFQLGAEFPPTSGDNLSLQGFTDAATLTYLRALGGRPNLHLYQVEDGAYLAQFIVQMAGDGSERLGPTQYGFL